MLVLLILGIYSIACWVKDKIVDFVQTELSTIHRFFQITSLVVRSFGNRNNFQQLLLHLLRMFHNKLNERRLDWDVKKEEAETRMEELVETSTRFYFADWIGVWDLIRYTKLLYRATRAVFRYMYVQKNCEDIQSKIYFLIDLARSEFPGLFN